MIRPYSCLSLRTTNCIKYKGIHSSANKMHLRCFVYSLCNYWLKHSETFKFKKEWHNRSKCNLFILKYTLMLSIIKDRCSKKQMIDAADYERRSYTLINFLRSFDWNNYINFSLLLMAANNYGCSSLTSSKLVQALFPFILYREQQRQKMGI